MVRTIFFLEANLQQIEPLKCWRLEIQSLIASQTFYDPTEAVCKLF